MYSIAMIELMDLFAVGFLNRIYTRTLFPCYVNLHKASWPFLALEICIDAILILCVKDNFSI